MWERQRSQQCKAATDEIRQIKEIDCPKCGAKDGIEVFERDGQTIGDSVCDQCGFTIPEGVVPELYLEEIEQK